MVDNSARVSAFGQRWTARAQESWAMMAGPPGLATIGHGARKDCGADVPGDQASKMGGCRQHAEHAGDQLQVPLLVREPTEPPAPNDSVTVIGAGLTITGNVKSKGDVQVEGEVQGDVHAQYILIGERARITGALIAEEIVVRGNVQGSILRQRRNYSFLEPRRGRRRPQVIGDRAGCLLRGQVNSLGGSNVAAAYRQRRAGGGLTGCYSLNRYSPSWS